MSNKGFAPIFVILVLAVVVFGAVVFGLSTFKKNTGQPNSNSNSKNVSSEGKKGNHFSERHSQGKCEGTGTTTFTHSPMSLEDIGEILPYGIMIDAHVLPTSHGYFYPAVFNSARDAYPVYAVADAVIVSVSHRGEFIGDNVNDRVTDEYQMYFEYSCTFYSYYDLLTSLSPEIEKAVGGKMTGFESKGVRIPVKAGQLVGRIGGQTVDFAVWNFEKTSAYFVNPKSYEGDEDRFYLEDMFKYFEEPLKSQLLAKAKRTVEPRSGRVDYDIEGKLVGNWFREGSNGFQGVRSSSRADDRYWDGHLSISYDFIEPSQIKFSIGNFEGKAAQFSIKDNAPDPAKVGVESGLIKYELVGTVSADSPPGAPAGTVLLQLTEKNKLKLELFPGKSGDQVNGFTSSALIYER
ncbi:MAG: hypothetical protein Q7S79_01515 [bacterium]|nr:hypothetical protein [bacterium]